LLDYDENAFIIGGG